MAHSGGDPPERAAAGQAAADPAAPDTTSPRGRLHQLRVAMRQPALWAQWLAGSRQGLWLIGAASFLETIIVPIPIELVLVPYMLANRRQIWTIATVTLAGCLIGAIVGYGAGYFLFETLGRWIIAQFEYGAAIETFRQSFDRYGFWAIIAVGVTPMPFQVAMLVAGAAAYPIPLFVLAAVIARGIRYYGLAALVCLFGVRALELWRRRAWTAGAVIVAVVAAIFVGVRFLPQWLG